MELLPNNCRVGKFTVLPKSWNTAKASLKEKWLSVCIAIFNVKHRNIEHNG